MQVKLRAAPCFAPTRGRWPHVSLLSPPQRLCTLIEASYKYLGITKDENLTFKPRIEDLFKKLELKLLIILYAAYPAGLRFFTGSKKAENFSIGVFVISENSSVDNVCIDF